MTTQINLKEIERKAFTSTYQDGLWDMYFGLVVVAMSIFMYRPAGGYTPLNPVMAVLIISAAGSLFMAGKKRITLPRMGQVKFGPLRKRKAATLGVVLGVLVLLQVVLLGFTAFGWLNPDTSETINDFLASRNLMDVAVATIGALIVGISFSVIAFFNDFSRGYYIALMASLAVFLMIYINQPLYPILLGGLIFLPGLVLFVRFLRAYPLPGEASNE
jgi:hypothetical protein